MTRIEEVLSKCESLTVSEGTLITEDIVEGLIDVCGVLGLHEIQAQARTGLDKYTAEVRQIESMLDEDGEGCGEYSTDGAEGDLEEIMELTIDRLEAALPEGWYYGASEGDGALLGLWRYEEDDHDDE